VKTTIYESLYHALLSVLLFSLYAKPHILSCYLNSKKKVCFSGDWDLEKTT
jgi:hypothetical protein